MTRNEILTEMYFSEELKRGAMYLLREFRDKEALSHDLLSDCVLDVFKKPDNELFDLYERKKLQSYIYFSMRNAIEMERRSGKFGSYGGNKTVLHARQPEGFSVNLLYTEESFWNDVVPEVESIEPLEITKDEKEYSEQLFGCTTKLNVQFMRAIEKADNNKANDIEAWECAQIAKLYFEFRSYRKVQKATGIPHQKVAQKVLKFIKSVTDKKMNVAVVVRGQEPQSGMELYRLHYTYFEGLAVNYSSEVKVQGMTYSYLADKPTGALEDDVYVFSRLADVTFAEKVLESEKKLVIDIDDYWNLHPEHPLKKSKENIDYVSNITKILPMAHLVTCTTPTLWEKLHDELGITATIIKNTIPDQSQFSTSTFKHSKVRIGYVGGLHHIQDMELMREGIARIYADRSLHGKFQFVLAGFNPNEHFLKYESVMTNDHKPFKGNDTDYYEYLKSFTPSLNHIGYNKSYRRAWALPVSSYGQVMSEIDVLLVPLQGKQQNGNQNQFNACKSELKLVEAAATGKAVICSDVMPYHPYLENEVNCLTVNPKSQNWYSQIRRMILDRELRESCAANLQKKMKKEFSHKNEVANLYEALKRLKK